MLHDRTTDEFAEAISLYALGVLEPAQSRELEQHLATGCIPCNQELRDMQEAAVALREATPPPPALRERVMSVASPQVWKSWKPERAAGELHVVRSGEGNWQTVRPGVHAKRLYVDTVRDQVTMLIRMDPGASWVPHRHAAPEQCFVLEGDIQDGGERFEAGDFQCLEPGSVHGAQTTDSGCLLLIVSSTRDELLV